MNYLTTSSPSIDVLGEDGEDPLKVLSDEGYMDDLINDFNAIADDVNFTIAQEHKDLEAESFIRDFVTADHLGRRALIQTKLQGAQRTRDLVAERGPLKKQWYQIGTKVTGPSEEEAVKVEETNV